MNEQRTMDLFHIKAPPDVEKRFRSQTFTQEDLERQYPGKITYSYRSIACHVWLFIQKELSLDCLPPPLIIDYRKNIPSTRCYDEKGRLITWINGMFNHSSISMTYGGSRETCVPMDYEVRLYHHNILEELKAQWGKHPVELSVLLTLTHTIMHEYMHFVALYILYRDTVSGGKDAVEKLVQYIQASNTITDEYTNENRTIQLMIRYWLTQPYHIEDFGDVILRGPYDLWKRETDEVWDLCAMYLEKHQLRNYIEGGVDSDNEYAYMKRIQYLDRQMSKLLGEHRDEAVNYILID